MLIVASGEKTVCIDVLKFEDLLSFVEKSSNILLSFDKTIKGNRKKFPMNMLSMKIHSMLSEYRLNEKYDYLITVCDSTMPDLFKLKIRVIDLELIAKKGKSEYLTKNRTMIVLDAELHDFNQSLYLEEIGISFFSIKVE